ncbi:PucR family transcriptional regulator [Streptomyces sp. NPDC059176]|uniref:PucR family transcriptional regulator n=1 Tax=unclassified Streptomyces TaxID=2593676 RepID=UPI0036CE338B
MPVSAAARALALRCERRAGELARRMAHESFEALPGYAELPADVKDLEIATTARHGVRLFLRRVADPRSGHGGYRLFRERAAQRAEEGMPLHLLLRTHALGMYVLWQALREEAGPGEEAALVELVDLLLQHHHGVVGAVAETYLDERSAIEAERRAQRRAVVRGLLDGMLPPGHASLDRLSLEGPLLVLAIDIGRPCAPEGPVVVRRRLRRIQTVLDKTFGTEVLTLLDAGPEGAADSGRAVVPADCEPPEDLSQRLSTACGREVRVAAVPAGDLGAVPEAARTATEVLRIARACGLPAGTHRLDDVLLEFHLSRPGPSGDRIAALLDPVGDRPELVETLRTHLEHRQDRRATAAALGLHPNTVDNRLAKIAQRTGLDLSSPRGTALALAALLLR